MTGGEPGCYPGLSVGTTGSRRGGAETRPCGKVVLGRDASQALSLNGFPVRSWIMSTGNRVAAPEIRGCLEKFSRMCVRTKQSFVEFGLDSDCAVSRFAHPTRAWNDLATLGTRKT
jgi:hypothetical protein